MAIEWQNVNRLILVGNHNQLPTIGRGRVFSDIIEWLREAETHNLAVLETNMRQMENRLDGKGQGILDLAELFLVDSAVQRSEEHTSELQSLMRISYAVFCLKKKNHTRMKT